MLSPTQLANAPLSGRVQRRRRRQIIDNSRHNTTTSERLFPSERTTQTCHCFGTSMPRRCVAPAETIREPAKGEQQWPAVRRPPATRSVGHSLRRLAYKSALIKERARVCALAKPRSFARSFVGRASALSERRRVVESCCRSRNLRQSANHHQVCSAPFISSEMFDEKTTTTSTRTLSDRLPGSGDAWSGDSAEGEETDHIADPIQTLGKGTNEGSVDTRRPAIDYRAVSWRRRRRRASHQVSESSGERSSRRTHTSNSNDARSQ